MIIALLQHGYQLIMFAIVVANILILCGVAWVIYRWLS